MKNLLFTAIAILGFSAISFGQTTATATAGGTIVTPIKIVKDANMEFGTLVASAGTVVLNPGTVPTYNTVVPYTGTDAVSPTTAQFTVSGNYSNTYAISVSALPTVVTNADDNSKTMALSAWSSTDDLITFTGQAGTSAGGALDGSGTQSFEIGATLTVAADQKAGVYVSPAFSVTVSYN